ncbi:GIN domain-containing protein [Brevundimonas aurifodinae]|uniref:DUF2807 domain-containing protein n=2 Tax=Brevundimonas TaxID=41275 RepID=A0ABV1NJ93_9CAUL|nr:MAG: hypothetical protein B7Z42_07325 [Brevundimonas sp. 12-68-7]OYX34787.1 MAG: hypothetical protein B7Z01_04405 [Brevundimonas subvibrioides]
MIRTLFIIAGAAFVLSIATIGGAAALGSRDLAANGWSWTFTEDEWGNGRIQRAGKAEDLGPDITRSVAFEGGERLELDLPADVTYVQGDANTVEIVGPQSVIDRIRVQGSRIWMDNGPERVTVRWDSDGIDGWSDTERVRITVTAPSVTTFDLEGSSDVKIRDYDHDTMAIDLSGSGEIEIDGRATALELDISGSGEADLSRLILTDANVAIAGSGEARLGPTGRADITISGSGDVELTQQPATLNQSISGSGDIDVVSVRSERRVSDTPPVTVSTTRSVEVTEGR